MEPIFTPCQTNSLLYSFHIIIFRCANSAFGIFYEDLKKPRTGGTEHTMTMCEQYSIPFIDQRIWFDWL